MSDGILLIGEPMGLFIAQSEGELDAVDGFSAAVAGAEYNVAVGMRRLEHPADYFTRLGRDPFGLRIARGMEQNGLNTGCIQWSDSHPTGFMLKSKVSSGDPRVFYFRKGSAASTLDGAAADSLDLSRYSHLHITGILPALSESCMEASRRLMRRARSAGLYVSFDPNLRPTLWQSCAAMIAAMNELAGLAELVLPGVGEGEILTGSRNPQQIASFYLGLGARAVVVKMGPQGAYAADAQGGSTIPGFHVGQVVDTVGAGDGFAVGVLSALMEGLPLHEAARRGNAIGAIQVTFAGDNEGLPTRAQLARFMGGERKE